MGTGTRHSKLPYSSPRLVAMGKVADVTRVTPGGNVKGGGPIFHLDKFNEMSEITLSGS